MGAGHGFGTWIWDLGFGLGLDNCLLYFIRTKMYTLKHQFKGLKLKPMLSSELEMLQNATQNISGGFDSCLILHNNIF